ncbi:MAG: peptidoglycan DD-metalloendopeptidase family protein [Hahellaceae bacterium]|nr:peptidoglycan DD-metalloendopeptidase family protein [Hahellaceae bacterium]
MCKKRSFCATDFFASQRLRGLRSSFLFITFLSLFQLSACTSPDIYQNGNFNPPVYFGSHAVRAGETLYSIAWRYGRDYRELAVANGIKKPYLIHPGQVVRLDLRGKIPQTVSTETIKNQAKTKSKVVVSDASALPEKASQKPKAKVVLPLASDRPDWRWPHSGPIIATYSGSGRKNGKASHIANNGIDIIGKKGDAIFAAASGQVVYAGNGLLGYGNLIIVNHDEHYLSAYAHNRVILVKEGQQVTVGDRIAEMGNSGSSRVMLHFEIRRDGQPVDPEKFLPARR